MNIKENWVIITSLLVTIFSIFGFVYSYVYYNEFGINYLNHAEISDLFSVLFIHPIFFISILIFFIGFFSLMLSVKPQKESIVKYENIWLLGDLYNNRFVIFGAIVFLIFFTGSYSLIYNKIEKIKSFNLPIQEITYNNGSALKCVVNIGSTSTSLFYWDINALETVIIPKNKIIKINIVIPKVPHQSGPPVRVIDGSKTEYQKSMTKWASDIENKCR